MKEKHIVLIDRRSSAGSILAMMDEAFGLAGYPRVVEVRDNSDAPEQPKAELMPIERLSRQVRRQRERQLLKRKVY